MNTAHAGSLLHPLMQQYIALQQALGRRYHTEQYVLAGLGRFLAHHTTPDLTAETFAAWCRTQNHLKPGVRRARLRIVRNFCLYRQRTAPQCFIPDPQEFPAPHQPLHPHLFTETEIVRLLQAAACLKPVPHAPLRAAVLRLAIILLYTTGLRRGELLRLVIGDYDPRAQTLLIRGSKFHKSRYLVLAADGARELEQYLQARRHYHLPVDATIPLIGHGSAQGRAYTGGGLGTILRQLCHRAAVSTADGRCPRVHDFRHSFAVQVLLRWYRNGDDVQAKLPFLATYMGHISIASTAYYLPFIEALAGVASARFAAQYATLVVPLSQPEEANP